MNKHERPYNCKECPGKRFTSSDNLKRHEREAHGKHGSSRTFVCPHKSCKRHKGRSFLRKEHLEQHLRIVHGERGTKPKQDSLERGDGEGLSPLGEVKRLNGETEQTLTNKSRVLTIDQLCS